MKPFENETHIGNEKAIRRGRVVPDGDVNLAFVKVPHISPKENIVVVDTSRIVEENTLENTAGCKLYYANSLGILVDKNDNMVIPDEFPAITDVFSVEEDFSIFPGSEYTDESILPFVHVSRYFHLDHGGLTMGGDMITYDTEAIKVVDNRGVEYSNYKIKIAPVYVHDFDIQAETREEAVWAYRVFAFIDSENNEDIHLAGHPRDHHPRHSTGNGHGGHSTSRLLYLQYNKVEITDDGQLVRRVTNHREILNPREFFTYTPEESEVVDPANRNEKIYSTKPVSFRDKILEKPGENVEGYKVYVPKKAVGDPRLYQLFRWRIKCTFTQEVTVDPSRDMGVINCGVIVTNNDLAQTNPSRAPFALLNLSRSRYNASGVFFRNLAQDDHAPTRQEERDYWLVNIDTDELDNYDLLIWAPNTANFNYSPYASKITDFVSNHGGTVFVDTNTYSDANQTMGGRTSMAIHPRTGKPRTAVGSNNSTTPVRADIPRWSDQTHPLIDGNARLGGWKLDDGVNPNINVMSYTQTNNRRFSQSFHTNPVGFTRLLEARLDGTSNTWRAVTSIRHINSGHKVFSTFGHLFTCSALFSHIDNSLINNNNAQRINDHEDYQRFIDGVGVEGAMKFLYNVALFSVKGRIIDSSDEEAFSTTWTYTTPWKSSWVIDASDGVLDDREKNEHNFLIDARDVHAATPDSTPVWKRRLSNKTVKQLMDEVLEPIVNNPATAIRVEGSVRTYEIEVTNPYVETGSTVIENDYPHAWTEAFTPKFTVPVELGPHIIKEEVDSAGRTGLVAQYDDTTYIRREYPEKPYSGQVTATYIATEEIAQTNATNYIASATAVATTRITTTTPARTVSKTSNISISWVDSQVSTRSSSTRGGPLNPSGSMWYRNNQRPHIGWVKPVGIESWQNENYYTSGWGPGHLNFPYWGHRTRLLQGSRGDSVKFAQDALNRFVSARYFSTARLSVDGIYGPATARAVRDFQIGMRARWVDGVIDAETWSLIGIQTHRLAVDNRLPSVNPDNYTRWFGRHNRLQMHRMSNGSSAYFAKRSWIRNGPAIIWDMFRVTFRERYNFHGVTIVPYVIGNYNRIMFRSIHVVNSPFSLRNYNSERGQLIYMPHRPRDGQSFFVPFGPYRGDTIIIGIGQDRSSGFGTSRVLGLRDIRGHARVTTTETIPSKTVITYQQNDISFDVTGSLSVESFKDRTIQLQVPKSVSSQYHSISNVRFNSITTSNPLVVASITTAGKATFQSQIVATNSGEEVVQGQLFPSAGFTFFSMDENGRFNPAPEIGWISKADGIKLLCDANKKPIGFPSMPTGMGANEAQRHYVKLSLGTTGTDNSVQLGFYDFSEKRFITSVDGLSEISFLEYLKRGPSNVYIAVISDYEAANEEVIPVDEDAPRLPYRWAMPVYGVCVQSGSKITLESLPASLGPHDVWPIAVREGRFIRSIKIRRRSEGGLTNYLNEYQGTTVQAVYELPEANLGGHSSVFGPPNMDVVNEEPIIEHDNILRVRQPPILMVKYPTVVPNRADPVRPVFQAYQRSSRTDPWVPIPFSMIKDYNVASGEIHLKHHLMHNDPSLLRVDYTSTMRHYQFKRDGDLILNLNAHSGHTSHLMGEAIYVYIVPHYIKDQEGRVIPDSINERTLKVSLSPNIFDPIRPEYDPLAIQLGVVYISAALDINKLAMIDTRKRGGGIKDSVNTKEITRLVNDASTYWDVNLGTGVSYQKSGYVIIRLPEELKGSFTESEIVRVIERNIASGVRFKVETLQGEDWS